MTDTVDRLIDELINREGPYVDHPADRGGPTRWGVTQATARADDGYAGDMRAYPRERAAALYRRIYWTRPGFDLVALRAPAIAAELFDTGVNLGVEVAAGFLQRALNGLNRGATDYPDLVPDGRIGPTTLKALDGFLRVRGKAGEAVLLKALESCQGERYLALAERRPANEAFLYGWLANRVGLAIAALALFAMPLAGCATTSAFPKDRDAVDRADVALGRVQAEAQQVLPNLPPVIAERVRIGLALAEIAMAVARGTTDPDERVEQLRRAAGAVAEVVQAVGTPRVQATGSQPDR